MASTPVIEAAGRRSVLGLVVIVALVIAGLTALDRFLAQAEMSEVRGAAERSYAAGKHLLDSGNAPAAVDPLRNAHSLERGDPRYELELAGALMAAGKLDEADPLVQEVLARTPNDGEANLISGRLRIEEGRFADAEAYYHRAIYGEWARNAAQRRVAARLELIGLLEKRQDRQTLLAEVIPLEAEAAGNLELENQAARLFIEAGSPARAAAVYRAVLARDPVDAASYAGLGEAELEQGQYREARTAFLQASYYQRAASIDRRLQLVTTLTELDPTPRRMASAEKYRRSLRILDLARADLDRRLAADPSKQSSDVAGLSKAAAGILAAKPPEYATNELAEQALTLAENIWKARLRIFGPEFSEDEESLRLIMEKLAS